MHALKWIGLTVAVVAAPAWATDTKKPAPSDANWATRPNSAEIDAAMKPVVTSEALYRAVVRCTVADDGVLSGCKVERETPANSGVGAATLSLITKYRRVPPGAKGAREIRIVQGDQTIDKAADWLRRPTPEQLLAVFPTEAYRRGQSGKAIINCIVTTQGALTDCAAIEETPPNAGFGGAAIALTPQFLMRPATNKGAPAPSAVNIPITFTTAGPGGTYGSKKVVNAAIAWSEAPTFAEVAAAYPAKGRAEKRGGRATLSCDMTEAGRLSRCEVATSDPRGYGFDIAAKALAKRFAIPVMSEEERKATRSLEVHLPITFDPAMLEAREPVVGKPSWARLPTAGQLAEAFKDVTASGTSRAALDCAIGAGGLLEGCRIASETPAGAGVGAAAMRLTSAFRMTTWTAEGLPVIGGRVTIPLRYEGGAAATTAPAPK